MKSDTLNSNRKINNRIKIFKKIYSLKKKKKKIRNVIILNGLKPLLYGVNEHSIVL